MRHGKATKHLGRNTAERMALFRGQTTDFFRHGHLVTTEAKAKQVRGFVERMITLGKHGDVHRRRQALAFVYDERVVKKLFDEIAPRYKERQGGYTRLTHLGPRPGDGARVVRLELV